MIDLAHILMRDFARVAAIVAAIVGGVVGGLCFYGGYDFHRRQQAAIPPAPAPRSIWVVERTPERVSLDKIAAELEKHVSEASAHVDAIVHRSLKDGQPAPLDADLAAIHKTLAKIEAAAVKLRATDATVAKSEPEKYLPGVAVAPYGNDPGYQNPPDESLKSGPRDAKRPRTVQDETGSIGIDERGDF